MMRHIYPLVIGSILVFTVAAHPGARSSPGSSQDRRSADWCADQSWGDDREGVCDVQEFTVPSIGGPLTVDASPNGGISVEGSSRGDVHVRARIIATAATRDEARAIAQRVQVMATADNVHAEGPSGLRDREGWYVSYQVEAPTATALSLKSTNGGIHVSNITSHIEFRTVNGGVKLRNVGGKVEGQTTNGGVDVDLEGAAWEGEGLTVQTSNGGVRMSIPAGYNAHLETGTVNGGIHIDFPVNMEGQTKRAVSTDIGAGGATLRVRTSNGGVKIQRK